MALVAAAELSGEKISDAVLRQLQPVDVVLRVMRLAVRANNLPLALNAAGIAMPFIHPRLSSVEVQQTIKRTLADYSTTELLALMPARQRAKFMQEDPAYAGAVDIEGDEEDEREA